MIDMSVELTRITVSTLSCFRFSPSGVSLGRRVCRRERSAAHSSALRRTLRMLSPTFRSGVVRRCWYHTCPAGPRTPRTMLLGYDEHDAKTVVSRRTVSSHRL